MAVEGILPREHPSLRGAEQVVGAEAVHHLATASSALVALTAAVVGPWQPLATGSPTLPAEGHLALRHRALWASSEGEAREAQVEEGVTEKLEVAGLPTGT